MNNNRLNTLLTKWEATKNETMYRCIVDELVNGETYLYVPTNNKFLSDKIYGDEPFEDGVRFTSVLNNDGLLSIVVFSSEQNLKMWAKQDIGFIKFATKSLLKFCDTKLIARIIIDAQRPSLFVLEKNLRNNTTVEKPQQNQALDIRLFALKEPFSGALRNNIVIASENISTILEVYHCGVRKNNKSAFMIGVKLSTYSDEAKKATLLAMDRATIGSSLGMPLEVVFLQSEKMYNSTKSIKDSLIYKRV